MSICTTSELFAPDKRMSTFWRGPKYACLFGVAHPELGMSIELLTYFHLSIFSLIAMKNVLKIDTRENKIFYLRLLAHIPMAPPSP